MLQVKHNTRSASAALPRRDAQPVPFGTDVNHGNRVMTLANAYERIPSEMLRRLSGREPLNYAVLQEPRLPEFVTRLRSRVALNAVAANGLAHQPDRDGVHAKWEAKTFGKDITLQSALCTLELANAAAPAAAKFKLNFTDGVVLTFARSDVSNPATLRATSLYDPQSAFRSATSERCAESGAILQQRLKFVSDSRGRLLQRPATAGGRAHTPAAGTFSADELYKHTPAPTTGRAGFTFTPVSYLSFLVKPNSQIPGCRPNLRNSNEQAIHYRPRLFRHPKPTFAPDVPIDGRNTASPSPPRGGSGSRSRGHSAGRSPHRPVTASGDS